MAIRYRLARQAGLSGQASGASGEVFLPFRWPCFFAFLALMATALRRSAKRARCSAKYGLVLSS